MIDKTMVIRMEKALGLTRKIVGIRFLYTWAEHQDCPWPTYKRKVRFCVMTADAAQGRHFKCEPVNFACGRSRKALGIDENDLLTESGEIFYSCGLYGSRAIAKQAQDNTLFIRQKLYGAEIGPLSEMEEADMVLLYGDAYQMMRLVQGYTYTFGPPKNISSVGNQGVCSDLCGRPFTTNDLNISFLCEGARRACGWSRNDIGAGMPASRFPGVANGIVQTLNLIDRPEEKGKILARLDDPAELGVEIDKKAYYGVSCGAWYEKRDDDRRRYEDHLRESAAGKEEAL